MGNLNGTMGRAAAMLILALVAMASGCSDDRKNSSADPTPIGKCLDGSNPDFLTDPYNCGACGVTCDGLHGEAICEAGVCRLADPVVCDREYYDLDGIPSNGCECHGATEQTCRTCLEYEIPMNEIDDDCDPGTTDRGPGDVDAIPLTRAHCGALNASCTLQPGWADTVCTLVKCSPSKAAAGDCGMCAGEDEDGQRFCGLCEPIGEAPAPDDACFDGIDQDGNGVVDDGPYCEVLLANAATPGCNLAAPDADCPPNVVQLDAGDSPLAALDVGLTYDVLFDRYEVTQRQFAAYLAATGQCEPDEVGDVLDDCVVADEDAMKPATEVTWCAAYDYCDWAGKRLPTVAEFYRASTGTTLGDTPCRNDPEPALAECGAHGVGRVDSGSGMAWVGPPGGRPDDALRALGIHNLTGHVAEWLFDAAVDWCAEDGPHAIPAFRDLTCPADGEGVPFQRRLLLDWAPSMVDHHDGQVVLHAGQMRAMSGGGFGSMAGTHDWQHRAIPGIRAPHHGFRCARTFHPDPVLANAWPYERNAHSSTRTTCDPLPRGGISAVEDLSQTLFRAVDICLPGLEPDENAALQQRVATSLISVFVVADGKDDAVDRLRLQAGLDAGSEKLWLNGLTPVVAAAEREPERPDACTTAACDVLTLDADTPALVIPDTFGAVRAHGLSVGRIAIGQPSPCLEPADTRITVEIQVDRAALDRLLADPRGGLSDEAFARLTAEGFCVDPEDGCQRWQVPLDIALDEESIWSQRDR